MRQCLGHPRSPYLSGMIRRGLTPLNSSDQLLLSETDRSRLQTFVHAGHASARAALAAYVAVPSEPLAWDMEQDTHHEAHIGCSDQAGHENLHAVVILLGILLDEPHDNKHVSAAPTAMRA
jgi:hypothetical protein